MLHALWLWLEPQNLLRCWKQSKIISNIIDDNVTNNETFFIFFLFISYHFFPYGEPKNCIISWIILHVWLANYSHLQSALPENDNKFTHKSNTHIHIHKHVKHSNNKRIWSLGRRTKTGWIFGNDQLYWLNTSYTTTNNSRCRSRGSAARQSSDWRPRQFTRIARRKLDHQQKCVVIDEVSFSGWNCKNITWHFDDLTEACNGTHPRTRQNHKAGHHSQWWLLQAPTIGQWWETLNWLLTLCGCKYSFGWEICGVFEWKF